MGLLKDLVMRSVREGDRKKRLKLQREHSKLMLEQKLKYRQRALNQKADVGLPVPGETEVGRKFRKEPLSSRVEKIKLDKEGQGLKLKTAKLAKRSKALKQKQIKRIDDAVATMAKKEPEAEPTQVDDILNRFQDPEAPSAPQQTEPQVPEGTATPVSSTPGLPPQLAKFVDPDSDVAPEATTPSSEPSDVPNAAISPADNKLETTPASQSPVSAQTAPPTQQSIFSPRPGLGESTTDYLKRVNPQGGQEFDAGMRGVGLGVKKSLHGIKQLGAQIVTKMGIMSEDRYKSMTKGMKADQVEQFNQILKDNPKANPRDVKAGVIAGEIAPYLLGGAGVGAGKTILGSAAKLGALGGVTGATQFVEPGQKLGRGFNILAGMGLGAAVGSVTGVLSRMAQGFTKKGAKTVLAEGLKQATSDKMAGRGALRAGRRLGVDVPMAEATQHPALLNRVNAIRSLSAKPKQQLTTKVLKLERDLTKKTHNMIDDVLKGDSRQAVKGKVTAMLDSISTRSVPKSTMKGLLKNPTIKNNLQKILANKNLQGDPNRMSYGKLDILKKQLRSEASGLIKAGKGGAESDALSKAAKQLDDALKGTSKRYKAAMMLAQRGKVYDKWSDKLQGMQQKAGKDQGNLKQIYTKLFDDDKVFGELVKDLSQAGGKASVRSAKDLRLVLNRMSSSPVGKLMGRQTELVTGMAIDQGPQGVLGRVAHSLFKRRYNNEIIRLMTSGKWDKELANIAKIKSTPRMMDRFAKLLTVVSTKTPGMATRKPMNDKKRNR